MSSMTYDPFSDFFQYTSGRWLWDEEKQLQERYRAFNVQELQKVACECVQARTCTSMAKIGEGGFNKVFRLTFENDATIIVRIPNPNAGPPRYTTASEVATMDFMRTILHIPVPKVLAWSSSSDGPVESEYLIMEEAKGSDLGVSWGELDLEKKNSIVEEIVAIEKKLSSVVFNRYGSLYYAADQFRNCVTAEVMEGIDGSLREEVRSRFVIGPVVERDFWHKERATMTIDRGPWKKPQDYLEAIGSREIHWISTFARTKRMQNFKQKSTAQDSPQAHLDLLGKFLDVAPNLLPQDANLSRACFWHRDMHSANIFTIDGRITTLIDWQGTWIGPLAVQAKTPRLLAYNGDRMLRLPSNFKLLDVEERSRLNSLVSASILMDSYERKTAQQNPLLAKLYGLKDARLRLDPIIFAGSTWDDDIIPLRESLIKVERNWGQLELNKPCPFKFTPDEIRLHCQDGEGWNEAQDFWDSVDGFVNREGWTLNETYPAARKMFFELRKASLEKMEGEELKAFEAATRWAEDLN